MNQILKNVKMIEHKPLQHKKVEIFLVIVINNKKGELCYLKKVARHPNFIEFIFVIILILFQK